MQKNDAAVFARNLLRILMMGWSPAWTDLISLTTLRAVFLRRDPVLLKEFRFAFQQGFLHLFSQLEGQELEHHQMEQVQMYLSNCLCLMVYSDLNPYESILIPQLVKGKWILVDYKIELIELTTQVREEDRVFAYGLEPIINKHACPHLIFPGTTYPAGTGFMAHLHTDMRPFDTVGSTLFKSGSERMKPG